LTHSSSSFRHAPIVGFEVPGGILVESNNPPLSSTGPASGPKKETSLQRHLFASTAVDAPFGQVQSVLRDFPESVFGDPADRGEDVHGPEFEVHAGPLPIHDRFTIHFGKFDEYPGDHFCRLRLRCHGDRHHVVVPDLDVVVEASDAGVDRTQLEVVGHYVPGMGALGALEDAIVGHRAVQETLNLIVAQLGTALEGAVASSGPPDEEVETLVAEPADAGR
jgi:hypothetical protein